MDTELTDITVILDRSGSMSSVKGATIEGFNTFVAKQREEKGRARLTLVQFDHEYAVVYERKDLSQVEFLTDETYVPRGGTALLDAIGRAVGTVEERLAGTAENDLPGKIIFLILTDGEERDSKEFTWHAIKALIAKKRGESPSLADVPAAALEAGKPVESKPQANPWAFVFVGANIDAVSVAAKMAIPAGSAMQYSSNVAGTRAAFNGVSEGMSCYRAQDDAVMCSTMDYFSADAKAAAMAPDPVIPAVVVIPSPIIHPSPILKTK